MTNSTNNANVARDNLFGNENQSAGYSKWVGVAGAAVQLNLQRIGAVAEHRHVVDIIPLQANVLLGVAVL